MDALRHESETSNRGPTYFFCPHCMQDYPDAPYYDLCPARVQAALDEANLSAVAGVKAIGLLGVQLVEANARADAAVAMLRKHHVDMHGFCRECESHTQLGGHFYDCELAALLGDSDVD